MKSFFKSRLVLIRVTLILLTATLSASLAGIADLTTAKAATGVDVFVGYADSLRANPTNFPTPWADSPNVTFEGCQPPSACSYDAGAVRLVNNTSATVTVNSVVVHVDTCALSGWPSASLAPGGQLIVTQVASGAANGCTPSGSTGPPLMDTSDIGPGGSPYAGNCTPDGIQPTVDVTIDGTTTTYTDKGQILNTGGVDLASCPSGTNESTQWTTVGSVPCPGAVLNLAPPSQTHSVGETATTTATLTNTCNVPLSGVTVNFQVTSGQNAGKTGTGVTDSNGQASFTYSSTQPGTDQVQASVTNPAGTITSNTASVTWTLVFAQGGSFVIGDLENHSVGASVQWWGAKWEKVNSLSGGSAPASFKGFEDGNSTPSCDQTWTWTTDTGNSSNPPSTVPSLMGVIVASHVTQSGSTISGDIAHIIVVRTDSGYQPDPGHPGTGTVITQVVC